MKNLLSIFCIVAFLSSCGTTGHIKFYNFYKPKKEIEMNLIEIINKDSAFTVPLKWVGSTTAVVLEQFFVYFSKSPEEMYRVGFYGDSTEWKESPTSTLALVAVYDGDRWRFESDLSSKEQRRMQKRFEEEILSKMKFYFYRGD